MSSWLGPNLTAGGLLSSVITVCWQWCRCYSDPTLAESGDDTGRWENAASLTSIIFFLALTETWQKTQESVLFILILKLFRT